jgi:hypothetical protein
MCGGSCQRHAHHGWVRASVSLCEPASGPRCRYRPYRTYSAYPWARAPTGLPRRRRATGGFTGMQPRAARSFGRRRAHLDALLIPRSTLAAALPMRLPTETPLFPAGVQLGQRGASCGGATGGITRMKPLPAGVARDGRRPVPRIHVTVHIEARAVLETRLRHADFGSHQYTQHNDPASGGPIHILPSVWPLCGTRLAADTPVPLYSPGARGRSRALSLSVGFFGTKEKPTGTAQAMRREAVRTSGAAA